MFTQAKTSATKPKPRAHPDPLEIMPTPTASSAPTTITDEIVKATLLTRDGAVVHPNFQRKA